MAKMHGPFASLANGWVAGASNIILQEAAFHGHVCEGTLGGYSIVQALLKYYSPVQGLLIGGYFPVLEDLTIGSYGGFLMQHAVK